MKQEPNTILFQAAIITIIELQTPLSFINLIYEYISIIDKTGAILIVPNLKIRNLDISLKPLFEKYQKLDYVCST